ncbi:MAG: hypothetical protein AB3N17_12485 [Tateyamaria sp.]
MSKRLVLHIGLNKTGTSSIQRMLLENRGVLRQSGWDYPNFHLLHMAHHPLAYSIAGHAQRGLGAGWKNRLNTLMETSEYKLIFSSELFLRTVDPEAVAEYFPPEDTLVVLYLREHLAYMMSWYAQAIQERNLTASFGDYLHLFSQSFSSYVERWENVYGADNMVTRVFDRNALVGRDSRIDFMQFIDGVDVGRLKLPVDDSNLSISGNLMFFKKILNNYMTQEEAMTHPITDEIGAFASVQDTFRGKFQVSRAEAALARKLFGPDLEAMAARGVHFPDMPREVAGHPYPAFDTLQSDFKLIKDIAVRTEKVFLKYAIRWQDWHSI